MPANQWQPPQTGDRKLDASFADLAARLDHIESGLDSLIIPPVRTVRATATIGGESYVEYRGSGGHVITLPAAAVRGVGRGALLSIQNFGLGDITVRAFSTDIINGVRAVTLSPDTGLLCSSNGVNKWTAAAAGSSPTPGGGTKWLNGSYLSGSWYPPGVPTGVLVTGPFRFGGGTANIIYAVPHVFSRAGLITDAATFTFGDLGTTKKVYIALYRSNAERTAPTERIFSSEHTTPDFTTQNIEDNGIDVSVDADEMIWFVVATPGTVCIGYDVDNLYPLLGAEYDGTFTGSGGGAVPKGRMAVGYREAFTYAQPPDPWTATTKLWTNNGLLDPNGVPFFFFKFTPS